MLGHDVVIGSLLHFVSSGPVRPCTSRKLFFLGCKCLRKAGGGDRIGVSHWSWCSDSQKYTTSQRASRKEYSRIYPSGYGTGEVVMSAKAY